MVLEAVVLTFGAVYLSMFLVMCRLGGLPEAKEFLNGSRTAVAAVWLELCSISAGTGSGLLSIWQALTLSSLLLAAWTTATVAGLFCNPTLVFNLYATWASALSQALLAYWAIMQEFKGLLDVADRLLCCVLLLAKILVAPLCPPRCHNTLTVHSTAQTFIGRIRQQIGKQQANAHHSQTKMRIVMVVKQCPASSTLSSSSLTLSTPPLADAWYASISVLPSFAAQ